MVAISVKQREDRYTGGRTGKEVNKVDCTWGRIERKAQASATVLMSRVGGEGESRHSVGQEERFSLE